MCMCMHAACAYTSHAHVHVHVHVHCGHTACTLPRCLWEILCTLLEEGSFNLALPPAQEAAFKAALGQAGGFESMDGMLSRVDVATAEAFNPADQEMIRRAVNETTTPGEINKKILNKLREWLNGKAEEAFQAAKGKERQTLALVVGRLLRRAGKSGEVEKLFLDEFPDHSCLDGPVRIEVLKQQVVLYNGMKKLEQAEELCNTLIEATRQDTSKELGFALGQQACAAVPQHCPCQVHHLSAAAEPLLLPQVSILMKQASVLPQASLIKQQKYEETFGPAAEAFELSMATEAAHLSMTAEAFELQGVNLGQMEDGKLLKLGTNLGINAGRVLEAARRSKQYDKAEKVLNHSVVKTVLQSVGSLLDWNAADSAVDSNARRLKRNKEVLVLKAKELLLLLDQARDAARGTECDAARDAAQVSFKMKLVLGRTVQLIEEKHALPLAAKQFRDELDAQELPGCALCVALGGSSDVVGVLALSRAAGFSKCVLVQPGSQKKDEPAPDRVTATKVQPKPGPAPGGKYYDNDSMVAYLLSLSQEDGASQEESFGSMAAGYCLPLPG